MSSWDYNPEKERTMSIHYGVIGAGRQGTAAAYELAANGQASRVTLFDLNEEAAGSAAARVNRLIGRNIAAWQQLDVQDKEAVERALNKIDAVISAVPYFYNLELTKAAIKTKTHLTDLGGNEEIVTAQFELNEEASRAGITIVPDCGMGPGMTGSLAAYGVSLMDEAQDVYIWDGGLPQNPEPPWKYQLTFHINGLTNEYFGEAMFLRQGRLVKVPTFSEHELLEFPPFGQLEAFVTSGGTSTALKAYANKLRTYENKTLRYPGHWEQFRAFMLLGLFELEPVSVGTRQIIPRDFFHALLEPKIKAREDFRDVCLIRVIVRGLKNGESYEYFADLVDRYDERTGFTSMERLTGWHAALMLELVARGRAKKGVHGLETAVDPAEFITEMKRRGFAITERLSPRLAPQEV
jgi:lysine 6-dehydrogenase